MAWKARFTSNPTSPVTRIQAYIRSYAAPLWVTSTFCPNPDTPTMYSPVTTRINATDAEMRSPVAR